MSQPLGVMKTYKMYVGGAFIRSESGRTFTEEGSPQLPLASRKDIRDAVVSAKGAQHSWAKKTPYNRGQILYRLAEMLDARRPELLALNPSDPENLELQLQHSVDITVAFAGWADKYAQVSSQVNPVAGPYFVFSYPEPQGVAGVLVPDDGGLLSLLARVLPVIVSGNTAVCVFETDCVARLTLGELLQTSDFPAGVINLLSGYRSELAPVLASHMGVRALDLAGASEDQRHDLLVAGADNLKRLIVPEGPETDFTSEEATSPERITAFCETKTVWHPVGS